MYIIQIARVICQHFSTSISINNIEYNSNQRIGRQSVSFGDLNNSDIYFRIFLNVTLDNVCTCVLLENERLLRCSVNN